MSIVNSDGLTRFWQKAKSYIDSKIDGFSSLPPGSVIMWTGETPPQGWALCDGQNGTPDLRNRFVVGAGSSYSVGATGGLDSVTLSESQLPSHKHNTTFYTGIILTTSNASLEQNVPTCPSSGQQCGSGTRSYNTTTSGSGQSHENRPPYYALSYIMKL